VLLGTGVRYTSNTVRLSLFTRPNTHLGVRAELEAAICTFVTQEVSGMVGGGGLVGLNSMTVPGHDYCNLLLSWPELFRLFSPHNLAQPSSPYA